MSGFGFTIRRVNAALNSMLQTGSLSRPQAGPRAPAAAANRPFHEVPSFHGDIVSFDVVWQSPFGMTI